MQAVCAVQRLHQILASLAVTLNPPLDEAAPQTRVRTGVAAGACHRHSAAPIGARGWHRARLQDVFPHAEVTTRRHAEPRARFSREDTPPAEEDLTRRLRLAGKAARRVL